MVDQEFNLENVEKLGSEHVDRLVQTVATSESAARLHRLLERAEKIVESKNPAAKEKAA